MDQTFTFDELAQFTNNEHKILEELGLTDLEQEGYLDIELQQPGKHVVNNILNYSKALSVRKSKRMGNIEIVNN